MALSESRSYPEDAWASEIPKSFQEADIGVDMTHVETHSILKTKKSVRRARLDSLVDSSARLSQPHARTSTP